jgi:malate dehydrogenase (oxaloacetate-decarboxylating)
LYTKEGKLAEVAVEVGLNGTALLTDPLLNKGMASSEAERTTSSLHGLLPPHMATLDEQVERQLLALRTYETNLERHLFLCDLQDTNETLFYALIARSLKETLPLVYTPTVGQGCQEFSHYWRYQRGLFLSYPHRDSFKAIFDHPRFDRTEVIVVSDGERILDLGDQGAGGMGIPIGKLSLYTACAGIDPAITLPILLDVGTDNAERLADPLYVGWEARTRAWARLRQIHRELRDSGARALAARAAAVGGLCARQCRPRPRPLTRPAADLQLRHPGHRRRRGGHAACRGASHRLPITEQRIVVVGAGSAGCGIASLLLREMIDAGLSQAEARARFYALDRDGLPVEDMPSLLDFQQPFAQPAAVAGWSRKRPGSIGLLDVVCRTPSPRCSSASRRKVDSSARAWSGPWPRTSPDLSSSLSPTPLPRSKPRHRI